MTDRLPDDPRKITFDTFHHSDGSHRYRLHIGGELALTSGGFLRRSDAERLGAHFASDPDVYYFLKEKDKWLTARA